MENGGIAPHTLNLSTIWQLAVSFTPRMLCHVGKNKQYQLLCGRQVSQPHSWSVKCRETHISCLGGTWTQTILTCRLVRIVTIIVVPNLNSIMLQVTMKYNQNVVKMCVMKHMSFVCECLHTSRNINIIWQFNVRGSVFKWWCKHQNSDSFEQQLPQKFESHIKLTSHWHLKY